MARFGPKRLERRVPSNNLKVLSEHSLQFVRAISVRRALGFFLQDVGPGMNLSRAAGAPSLRPVIAKNGDTDVQVRKICLGVHDAYV
jgi:hypothetical protein